ncbi:MAG: exodeoxyribonuclease VII large subunit [Candidatus Omnitrophica bacterium]|nr:exodeoxyribonuclease VII large subunit [Candidatus Omnitrophota bacterium]
MSEPDGRPPLSACTKNYSRVVTEPLTLQVYSVSDLTRNIRFSLEENFSDVWVEGEVSNFKLHTSGHMYFSLKDAESQIQCVMFRRENQMIGFELKEGLKALCFGRVSVYPARGSYQLYVARIEPKGVGSLQLRFEELKEKLRKEGFFDIARKRPIPFLPRTIGVVTSIDGAALRDILHVLERRFQNAHIVIVPTLVQGPTAAPLVAEAIADLNIWNQVDVILLARGGGSLEDLWAFNEEVVARAIFESQIPIISAIGHEVDTTIADFVADLRAATPSAAAEIVMPEKEELVLRIQALKERAIQALRSFEVPLQRLDELRKSLSGVLQNAVLFKKERLSALMGKLEALGPLSTLQRGFSVSVKLPDENVITSYRDVKPGDIVKTKLKTGFFTSQVKEVGS